MLLVAAAAALLGPPLGRLLTPDLSGYTFTTDFSKAVRPEPAEHARFLIALALPLLIALATLLSPRWIPHMPRRLVQADVVTGLQALFALVLVACYVRQVQLRFGPVYTEDQGVIQLRYFTTPTLLVAALLAGAVVLVVRHERSRALGSALLRDSRARSIAVLLLVAAVTAVWMLHAVQSDTSLANAREDMRFHISFPLDETFAVLNGLTPLVSFTAQYGSLWPFPAALTMLALGKSVLVFSIFMCTITVLALLAIFGVLRRVTRSSVAALLLYLPFMATSLFFVGGDLVNRTSVGTYYGTFPLRYAGPYFLALLTARELDRGLRTAGAYLLFLVGGLAILNNADFGVAALGATVAAFVWSGAGRERPPLRTLALAAGGGLLTALALVSLVTLVRAGSLPQLGRLVDFARLFGVAGFAMLPVPGLLGMHTAIYLTYVATIAVATVRALRGETDRLLTGMLAWTGIFGLGSASYYVGRSHPVALKSLFSVWALALALLTVVVVRELAKHPRRRLSIATVAVLFGFGVAACSLAQTPAPWSQLERLGAPYTPTEESDNGPRPLAPSTDPRTRRFVATLADGPHRFVYKRGAPVAILLRTGHRVADAYGVRNVSPYTGMESTVTVQRVERVLDILRREGGNTVILPNPVDVGIFRVLERRGFRLVTHRHGLSRYNPRIPHSDAVILLWPYDYVIKWVDTRHLHPRALE
ncbi:MAG TPA: hypothetical protein VFS37_10850 [Conexibacter sp.]|nr:hypothetical protein [Conexibacter sp.]